MNDNVPPVFILDANIFIEAHKRYYGLARIHRWTGMDGVRTLEVGRGSNRRGWSGLEFG